MLNRSFLGIFNHLLGQAPWAEERLRAHAGRRARIEVGSVVLQFRIDDAGRAAACSGDEEPDVRLQLPPDALSQALGGLQQLMGAVHISGNAEFADALGFVLRNLRWNSAEDLSRVVGDMAAHRIDQGLRGLLALPPRLVASASRTARDYLVDEHPTLVERPALEQFGEELAQLRDACARLEKRLGRLGS